MLSSDSDLDNESFKKESAEDLFSPWKKETSPQGHLHSKSNVKITDIDKNLLIGKEFGSKSQFNLIRSNEFNTSEKIKPDETRSQLDVGLTIKLKETIKENSIQPLIKSSKLSKKFFSDLNNKSHLESKAYSQTIKMRKAKIFDKESISEFESVFNKEKILLNKRKSKFDSEAQKSQFYFPNTMASKVTEFNNMLEGPLYIGRTRKESSLSDSLTLKKKEFIKKTSFDPVKITPTIRLDQNINFDFIKKKAEIDKRRVTQFISQLETNPKSYINFQPTVSHAPVIVQKKNIETVPIKIEPDKLNKDSVKESKIIDTGIEKPGAYSVEVFNLCKKLEEPKPDFNLPTKSNSTNKSIRIKKDKSKELIERMATQKKNDILNTYKKLSNLSKETNMTGPLKNFRIFKDQTPKRIEGLTSKINLS